MLRLRSLIPALRPMENPGRSVGMRGQSVSTIHVKRLDHRAEGRCRARPSGPDGTGRTIQPSTRFIATLLALCLATLMLTLPVAAPAATLPGTVIDNTATATFNGTETATSNLVRIVLSPDGRSILDQVLVGEFDTGADEADRTEPG